MAHLPLSFRQSSQLSKKPKCGFLFHSGNLGMLSETALKKHNTATTLRLNSNASSQQYTGMSFPNVLSPLLQSFANSESASSGSKKDVVLVAGATGRVGYRTVRELLRAGYTVRAGVRNVEKAEELFSSDEFQGLTRQQLGRLKIVEMDVEDSETLLPAIGNASRIVCTLGASESDLKDFSAPRRIDGEGTIRLIEAAVQSGGIHQFILVTSLGTGKFGWPASALNIFGGILIQKRRAEKFLEGSGLRYLIVRPGGMERPTDAYKETHNVRLVPRDSLFGGQVSCLQIAELIGCVMSQPLEATENRCFEVVAETTAPLLSCADLLLSSGIDADIVQSEERNALLEKRRDLLIQRSEAERAVVVAEDVADSLSKQIAFVQQEVVEAREEEASVRKEWAPLLAEVEKAEAGLEGFRMRADRAAKAADAEKAVVVASQKAQRDAVVLSSKQLEDIRQSVLNPPSSSETSSEAKENPKKPQPVLPPIVQQLFQQSVPATQGDLVEKCSEEGTLVLEEEESVVSTREPARMKRSFFSDFLGRSDPSPATFEKDDDDVSARESQMQQSEISDETNFEKGITGFFKGSLLLTSFAQRTGQTTSAAATPLKTENEKKDSIGGGASTPETDSSRGTEDEGDEDIPENVREARQWIKTWREKTLMN